MLVIDRKYFYDNYRNEFGRLSQKLVNALNFLLDRLDESEFISLENQQAGTLANIGHETAWTFEPIRERGPYSYFRYLIGRLGNRNHKEAYDYRGGGFIQTTGKSNYIMMNPFVQAKYPDIDIVKNPEKITDPNVSWITTEIGLWKGLYTGKKINDYLTRTKTDLYNFRRCINGTDRAKLIEGYGYKFLRCIKHVEAEFAQAGYQPEIELV